MKKCAVFITTLTALMSWAVFSSAEQPVIPPAPPLPGNAQPASPGAETATDTNVISITIGRTFTNDPNSIIIIGTASSEQEKQAITAKVQEAAPGKTINNQLMIEGQSIFEPSGAESDKDKEKDKSSEELDDDSDDKLENDSEQPDDE